LTQVSNLERAEYYGRCLDRPFAQGAM